MKKEIFFVTCTVLFLISCDKLFINISGKEADLQGKWQQDDADTVFYNFQNSLFGYQIYLNKGSIKHVFGYYNLYGDTAIDLRLLREYADFSLDILGWDTLYSTTGQDTIYKAFKIEALTSKKLVLRSDKGKTSFHKF